MEDLSTNNVSVVVNNQKRFYPSIEYTNSMFMKFNQEFFESKLDIIEIVFNYNKSRYGYYRHKRFEQPIIALSLVLNNSEKEFLSTLIHEMIHYYLDKTGKNDATAHGPNFKSMMKYINRVTNNKYNIQVSGGKKETSLEELLDLEKPICSVIDELINSNRTSYEQHILILLHHKDGKKLLCRITGELNNFISKLERKHFYMVAKYEVYTSNNVVYKKFRGCRNRLHGFYVTSEQIPKCDLHPLVSNIQEYL